MNQITLTRKCSMKILKVLVFIGLYISSFVALGCPDTEQAATDEYVTCFTKEQWDHFPKAASKTAIRDHKSHLFSVKHWPTFFEMHKIDTRELQNKLQNTTEGEIMCFTKEQWDNLPLMIAVKERTIESSLKDGATCGL